LATDGDIALTGPRWRGQPPGRRRPL